MREDPRKFRIGQVVRVEDIARRVSDPEVKAGVKWVKNNPWTAHYGRPWNRMVKPFNGIIIGATRRQEGRKEYGYSDEPGYFVQSKTVLLWKVATSYLGNPVLVFEESIMPVSLADFNIPWSPSSLFWSKQTREDLSKDMKQIYQEQPGLFPRDEKGRFCKSD